MSSPILWGPGGIANNLENSILNANGTLLNANGQKQYIPNSTFANGAITGYSLFNTTLTSGLPTGTVSAGASSLSIGINAVNVLEGSYQLQIVAAAAVTAGQGVITDQFVIDRNNQSTVLSFKVGYEFIAGASNVNLSGVLGSQSFAVYLYDVSNSAWIQPTGFLSMTSLGSGLALGTFQTNALGNGNTYRLAVICLQATGVGGMTLNLSTFGVSPVANNAVSGQVSAQYTTTTTQSVSTVLPVNYTNVVVDNTSAVTTGAAWKFTASQAGTYHVSTSLITSTGSTTAQIYKNGSYHRDLMSISTTAVSCGSASVNLAAGDYIDIRPAAPVTLLATAANSVSIEKVSSISSGGADDARSVIMAAFKSTAQTGTTSVATTTTGYDAAYIDTHAAFNASTGIYTVPTSGRYKVTGNVMYTSSATGYRFLLLNQTGSVSNSQYGGFVTAVNGDSTMTTGVGYFDCKAGDTLSMQFWQNSGGALGPRALGNGTSLLIEKMGTSGSVVQAAESVNAKYTTTAATVLSNGNTIIYGTNVYDSHSGYNSTTGIFTAPVAGKYAVKAGAQAASFTPSAGNFYGIDLAVNGTTRTDRLGLFTANAAIAQNIFMGGTATVKLNAGDTIRIIANVSSGTFTLNADSTANYIAIEKVGN